MARRRSASGVRRAARDRKARPADPVYGVPVPEGLHEAIETERDNLSKAESLLGCLAIAMEYESDTAKGPYYPDVAQLARELVRQSINGLDSVVLEQRLARNKVKEDHAGPPAEDGHAVIGYGYASGYEYASAGAVRCAAGSGALAADLILG
jgi:hypothetical protein